MEDEVFFESLESVTKEGAPVFNKVSFQRNGQTDIWFMDQSHHGPTTHKWDTIAIKVNRNRSPFKVSFHQYQKTGEKFPKYKEIKHKANCFRCHSNGPRLIRPKNEQNLMPMAKLTLFTWNNRIKSYGVVSQIRKGPLKKAKVVELKSCVSCHSKNGVRAELTEEQLQTMNFLVDNDLMPPWPHKISKEDNIKLKELVFGF